MAVLDDLPPVRSPGTVERVARRRVSGRRDDLTGGALVPVHTRGSSPVPRPGLSTCLVCGGVRLPWGVRGSVRGGVRGRGGDSPGRRRRDGARVPRACGGIRLRCAGHRSGGTRRRPVVGAGNARGCAGTALGGTGLAPARPTRASLPAPVPRRHGVRRASSGRRRHVRRRSAAGRGVGTGLPRGVGVDQPQQVGVDEGVQHVLGVLRSDQRPDHPARQCFRAEHTQQAERARGRPAVHDRQVVHR